MYKKLVLDKLTSKYLKICNDLFNSGQSMYLLDINIRKDRFNDIEMGKLRGYYGTINNGYHLQLQSSICQFNYTPLFTVEQLNDYFELILQGYIYQFFVAENTYELDNDYFPKDIRNTRYQLYRLISRYEYLL